ncbi:hypothetical protein FALBO_12785 [Fusarium albosuccineum]|uniref:Uncharacterized protein n=1 Tax=Fusarium albosuccineum TaxID=1237068 RepID=A0A8H4L1R5_9HYPO|nr:hypothetical protein FALBO_12785 [Fusarium albosuccineum]
MSTKLPVENKTLRRVNHPDPPARKPEGPRLGSTHEQRIATSAWGLCTLLGWQPTFPVSTLLGPTSLRPPVDHPGDEATGFDLTSASLALLQSLSRAPPPPPAIQEYIARPAGDGSSTRSQTIRVFSPRPRDTGAPSLALRRLGQHGFHASTNGVSTAEALIPVQHTTSHVAAAVTGPPRHAEHRECLVFCVQRYATLSPKCEMNRMPGCMASTGCSAPIDRLVHRGSRNTANLDVRPASKCGFGDIVILAPGPSLSAAQPPEIRQASRWDMILDPQSAPMQLDASMPLSFPSHTCCDNSQSAIQRLDKVQDLSSKSQLVASAGYGAASFEATSGGSASGLCSTVLQTEPRVFDEGGTVNPPCSIQDKEAMHLSIWGRSS